MLPFVLGAEADSDVNWRGGSNTKSMLECKQELGDALTAEHTEGLECGRGLSALVRQFLYFSIPQRTQALQASS